MIRDYEELPARAQDWWSYIIGSIHLGEWSERELRAWVSDTAQPGSRGDLCRRELLRREALG